MKSRNHALNFLKLFFLAVIVIHHSGIAIIPHGYIGVEFFFMTSGYFIYQTYLKKQSLTLAAYTKKRFFKLYPHYIFSFTAMAVFFLIFPPPYTTKFTDSLAEIFMVQNIGIFNCYRINYPCWYLSVLMFASILVYGFFKISSKAVRIGVSVGCILLTYSYIFLSYRQLENFDTVFIFYIPFWRGVSDLLLGALAYDLQLALSKSFFERNIPLTRITECTCFFGISVLLFIDLPVDLILAFLIFILITAVSSPHSVINRLSDNAVFKWLIKYEYAIFLNHALVIDAMTHLPLHLWYSRLAVLALLLITYSVLTTKLVDWCCGMLKKLSAKLFKKRTA